MTKENTNASCQNGRINSFTQLNQMEQQANKPRFGGEQIRVVYSKI